MYASSNVYGNAITPQTVPMKKSEDKSNTNFKMPYSQKRK